METITKTTTPQPVLRLLASLFFLCLFAPMVAGQDSPATDTNWKNYLNNVARIANENGGDGTTRTNAILIASAEELAYFARQVNSYEAIEYGNGTGSGSISHNGEGSSGEEGYGFSKYYFALSADIDLSAHYWMPIGKDKNYFNGHFDGRGHCVSGLKVEVEVKNEGIGDESAYAGLFGNASSASLRNLGVILAKEGVKATATNGAAFAGGIAGQAKVIHNCYVVGTGKVEAVLIKNGSGATANSYNSYSGGIVGYLSTSSSLTHCYATVSVKAEGESILHAGGIVGSCQGSLSYTYATGSVEATGGINYAGGICGYIYRYGTLSHNLALNEYVKGNEGWSNRIVGKKENDVKSDSNYASSEIWVNDGTVDGGGDVNGDADITCNDFKTKLESDWKNGWSFDAEGLFLPKLQMIKEDDDGNLTYEDWPDTTPSQPSLKATDYLSVDNIANAGGGKGLSWDDPILIANRAELAYFAKQVNSGAAITLGTGGSIEPDNQDVDSAQGNYFSAYFFALTSDILSQYCWTPIGNEDHPFNGHFDGRGHCVEGLKVKVEVTNEGESQKDAHAGLFGRAGGASLRNLGVILAKEGVQAKATDGAALAGGIAGEAKEIHNCYVVGTGKVETEVTINRSVEAHSYSGGIVGYLSSSLTRCYATVSVKSYGSAFSFSSAFAGGIAGQCRGTLSCTYATGAVAATGGTNNYAGGICGYMRDSNTLTHNLALNNEVKGDEGKSHRIAGYKGNATLTSNYASTKTEVKVGHNPSSNATITPDVNGLDGADTWIETFKEDLMSSAVDPDGGWSKGWVFDSNNKYLPQLKEDSSGGGNSKQPSILSRSVLDPKPVPPPPPVPEPEPEPVPVYYTVTLPSVEGAVTDPVAGDYDVEAWSTFRFYLTLDTAYSLSQPVITTSRGETLSPRATDGAYLLKYVRTDVEVFIDGVVKNPDPVSNEPIRAGSEPEIWSEKSCLCFRPADSEPTALVRILTVDGRLLETFRSVPGLNRRQLPTGIYIVLVGDTVRKVIVR